MKHLSRSITSVRSSLPGSLPGSLPATHAQTRKKERERGEIPREEPNGYHPVTIPIIGGEYRILLEDCERFKALYRNRGDGTFEEVALQFGVACNAEAARVSGMGCDMKDFNNDGWVDIFDNNLQNQIHALFRNEAGQYFDYVSPQSGVAQASRSFSGWSNGFVDFNNDGWKDIYSANGDVDYLGSNSAQHDTMLKNVDGRLFVDVSRQLGDDFLRIGYQRGSALGDLNGDGFLDIVVTFLNEKTRILLKSADNGNYWLLLELRGSKRNRDVICARAVVTTASGRTLYQHVSPSVGFMSSSDKRLHFGLGAERNVKSVEIIWPGGERQTLTKVRVDTLIEVVQGR